MLGTLHQNQHIFERPTPPLLRLKFPRYRQNRRLSTLSTEVRLYTEKTFFV